MMSTVLVTSHILSSIDGGVIYIREVATGDILRTLKFPLPMATRGTKHTIMWVPRHCMDRIGHQFVVFGFANSPILAVMSMSDQKKSLHLKMILPGIVRSLAVTEDGAYILVGIDNKLYVWQTATGYLLNVLEGHYQYIRVIRIATDCSYAVTGGDDGQLLIWDMTRMIVPEASLETFTVSGGKSSAQEPVHVILDFTTGILDIHLGPNGRMARFFVCAERCYDVKIYQLCTGKPLAVVTFPSVISSIVLDQTELKMYCGAENGDIFELLLSTVACHSDNQHHHLDLTNKLSSKFCGHMQAINSMVLDYDQNLLISASQDCRLRIYHLISGECLTSVICDGPICNLAICPRLCIESASVMTTAVDKRLAIKKHGPKQLRPVMAFQPNPVRFQFGSKNNDTFSDGLGCRPNLIKPRPTSRYDKKETSKFESVKAIVKELVKNPGDETSKKPNQSCSGRNNPHLEYQASTSTVEKRDNGGSGDSGRQNDFDLPDIESGPEHEKCREAVFKLYRKNLQLRKSLMFELFYVDAVDKSNHGKTGCADNGGDGGEKSGNQDGGKGSNPSPPEQPPVIDISSSESEVADDRKRRTRRRTCYRRR